MTKVILLLLVFIIILLGYLLPVLEIKLARARGQPLAFDKINLSIPNRVERSYALYDLTCIS